MTTQGPGKRPIRVLHCPMSVGGNPQGLAQAERKLGLESYCAAQREDYFRFKADVVFWKPGEHPARGEFRRWKVFWDALRKFDIIHYNAGRSLFYGGPFPHPAQTSLAAHLLRLYMWPLHLVDPAIFRELGKGIVVTYQGDDARQGDYCRRNFDISIAQQVGPEYYNPRTDALKRRSIEAFGKKAHRVYALNPDLLHVLPAKAGFLPYANVDIRDWVPAPPRETKGPLVLVHAPTHRRVKGTDQIVEAVERVRREEKLDLEFVLVENMSREEARRQYLRADLLVDQLYAGWYGGLAVELMALGKPVMCYLREGDLKFLPPGMAQDLPIIRVEPQTLTEVLRTWMTLRRPDLREWGARGRAYVERWHDPIKIATGLKEQYERILEER